MVDSASFNKLGGNHTEVSLFMTGLVFGQDACCTYGRYVGLRCCCRPAVSSPIAPNALEYSLITHVVSFDFVQANEKVVVL